ncbi:MAG: hypothetical protein A2020_15510 [Lentisphaerae bacterium GWF2_45_14]|nr:MAG: hypothetical protein A2020_15510 [Lentisphaerae bacterium GWF2_45_14]
MEYRIIPTDSTPAMEPLTCLRPLLQCHAGGMTLENAFNKKLSSLDVSRAPDAVFTLKDHFWPSASMLLLAINSSKNTVIISKDGEKLAWVSEDGSEPIEASEVLADDDCVIIDYPWDLLAINEEIINSIEYDEIEGVVKERVTIEGKVKLGKGSVILPGVYIEGNAVFGENCKIGPNCYIRGATSAGDKCHIGQAVEIKNSILMDNVSIGHLSYVGDSVMCSKVNFGAGTITANLRHDGKNHRSMVEGSLVDTGRRKLGVIIGDNVHTGIHTSFYPGRKMWPGFSTCPGEVVQQDIMPVNG